MVIMFKIKVVIEIDLIPQKNIILIKAREPTERDVKIIVNGKSYGKLEKELLENGFSFNI